MIRQLDALHPVGVIAGVINCVTLTDGTLRLVISGVERAAIVRPVAEEFLAAEVAPIEETGGQTVEAIALSRAVLDAYRTFAKVDYSTLPQRLQARFASSRYRGPRPAWPMPSRHCCRSTIEQRQQLLETSDVVTRLEAILELMNRRQRRLGVTSAGNPPLPCSIGMGTCRFPVLKALADAAAFGHIWRSGRPFRAADVLRAG